MAKLVPVAVCLRNSLFRECIGLVLQSSDLRVCASEADCRELKIKITGRFIILLDGPSDDGLDTDAIVMMRSRYPNASIVVLMDSCSQERRWRIERLGVSGVLLKSVSSAVLLASLKLVTLGEQVFSAPGASEVEKPTPPRLGHAEQITGDVIMLHGESPRVDLSRNGPNPVRPRLADGKPTRRSDLSDRELEILSCLVGGHSNKVIARRCQITEATVKVHLKAILRKTDVMNRTQAAVWAMNNAEISAQIQLAT